MNKRDCLAFALFGACCTLVGAGCSVYDESLVGNAAGSGPKVCEHTTWPSKPARADPGDEHVDIVGALTFFDLGEPYKDPSDGHTVPARVQGYDLDNTCTTNPDLQDPTLNQGSSCITQGWVQTPTIGDLPGGRDNGLRYIVYNIGQIYNGFGTLPYIENIKLGRVSLLLSIKNYNGQRNDDHVDLAVLTTGSFTQDGANGGVPAGPDGGGVAPKFDGTDVWPIASDSFYDSDPNKPRLTSRDAWVTNGVMVGALGDLDFRLRIGVSPVKLVDLRIQFLETFFTAKISKDERGLWVLKEGQIASRWRVDDLLAQVKYFPNPLTGGPLCMNRENAYGIPHNFICAAADIYSGPPSPSAPCNAVSVGIGFEGVQAKMGNVFPLLDLGTPCPDKYDTAHDSCSHPYIDPDGDAGADAGAPDGG